MSESSVFTAEELTYLHGAPKLGRVATVGADGTPHVVVSGWVHNTTLDTIDVTGRGVEHTKKYRDVARNGRAAFIVDDLASVDPWRPRAVEVRGRAEAIASPSALIRIYPERIVSWGLGEGRSARTVGGQRGSAAAPGRPDRLHDAHVQSADTGGVTEALMERGGEGSGRRRTSQ